MRRDLLATGVTDLIYLLSFAVLAIVAWSCASTAWALLRGCGPDEARRQLARGLLHALSIFTATALLSTIRLTDWNTISFFCAVLALRTLVKVALQAEAANSAPY